MKCREMVPSECYSLIKILITACSKYDSVACHRTAHFCRIFTINEGYTSGFPLSSSSTKLGGGGEQSCKKTTQKILCGPPDNDI